MQWKEPFTDSYRAFMFAINGLDLRHVFIATLCCRFVATVSVVASSRAIEVRSWIWSNNERHSAPHVLWLTVSAGQEAVAAVLLAVEPT